MNKQSPIIFSFMGGFASGSSTAANFFKNYLGDILNGERDQLKRDGIFSIDPEILKKQTDLAEKKCNEIELKQIKMIHVYKDIIKKYHFNNGSINEDNLKKQTTIIYIENELKSLRSILEKYQECLNLKIEFFKKINTELQIPISDLYKYTIELYYELENKQKVEKKLHMLLSHMQNKKENEGLLQFNEEIHKNIFNLPAEDKEKIKNLIPYLKDLFNCIMVKKYSFSNVINEIDLLYNKLFDLNIAIESILNLLSNSEPQLILEEINRFYDDFRNKIDDNINLERLFGQSKGNMMRIISGGDYLGKKIKERIINIVRYNRSSKRLLFAINTLKHSSEIGFLRKEFADIHFIALDAPVWERTIRTIRKALYEVKGFQHNRRNSNNMQLLDLEQLDCDMERDKDEKYLSTSKRSGQQVEKCIEQADIIINTSFTNYKINQRGGKDLTDLYVKLLKYFFIATIPGFAMPTDEEILMAHAYNVSLQSGCLQRQVGAVIVDKNNNIVSTGYNDPPKGVPPCNHIGNCQKKNKLNIIKKMCRESKNMRDSECEVCLRELQQASKQCPIIKINNDIKFGNYCGAIHAEEDALLNLLQSGIDNSKCKLYSTTKPCYACAKRIVNMGFKKIIFREDYTDPLTEELIKQFQEYPIELTPFQGVTSNSFFRYYKSYKK